MLRASAATPGLAHTLLTSTLHPPARRCNMVDAGAEGPETIQWTLYFKEGGVGTFIPL